MAKVGKANPPGRHPGQGLLQVGQARDKLKLLRSFGLSKETALSKVRDYWREKKVFRIANLLLTVLESLNPRESDPVSCEEEAAQVPVVDPAQWTTLFCWAPCACRGRRISRRSRGTDFQ